MKNHIPFCLIIILENVSIPFEKTVLRETGVKGPDSKFYLQLEDWDPTSLLYPEASQVSDNGVKHQGQKRPLLLMLFFSQVK